MQESSVRQMMQTEFAISYKYQAGGKLAESATHPVPPELALLPRQATRSRVAFAMQPASDSNFDPDSPVVWYPSVSYRF